ncbi:hypothetical protein EB796_005921 [Bugula neritina]|uniref:Uncharacterized protein n=1 Tax=Bugula neritina TaxID=10212 RepID=A0A7J7KE11_BUGNE|nr:hypothetical protein EB796_005921 [Bugula neritina]
MLRVQCLVPPTTSSSYGEKRVTPYEYNMSHLCFFQTMVPDLVAISGNKQTTLTAISQLTPTGLGKDKEVGRGEADEVFQLPKVSEKKELSAVGAAAVSPAEQKRRGI